jgi:sugar-specific transcriptional regulator TrmB
VLKDNKRIDLLEQTFNNFKEKNNYIFFEGQIYDAYSLLIDILNKSKKDIIIIDNYAGKELLDILKNINKNITKISKNITEELIKKYNKQYNNVSFINNNSFHDRFIIIDNEILYHCGSSFKDMGTKCFAINRIDDKELLNNIIKNLRINNES